MGQVAGTMKTWHLNLNQDDKPTFDTNSGFKFRRAKRVMIAKEEHLVSARIPPKYRDYCAHCLLNYQVCRYKNFPFVHLCHHERHAYLCCEHEDYIVRMKEFERERRLREREIRIQKQDEEAARRSGPRCPD